MLFWTRIEKQLTAQQTGRWFRLLRTWWQYAILAGSMLARNEASVASVSMVASMPPITCQARTPYFADETDRPQRPLMLTLLGLRSLLYLVCLTG